MALSTVQKILTGVRFPYQNKHYIDFNGFIIICTFKCQTIKIYGDNLSFGTEKARKVICYHQKKNFLVETTNFL